MVKHFHYNFLILKDFVQKQALVQKYALREVERLMFSDSFNAVPFC